mmetsp:Transcript_26501/g.36496  ORF Transcript_26501/g.36496 Transcript_26501/m.36496 type:complete len:333 (-) Transcript_26501:29-1027(-)
MELLFLLLIIFSLTCVRCIGCERRCSQNDTYCGDWIGRTFVPYGNCPYRQFTSEEARKCVGNRTLLFTGDSQIRDIGIGVGLFLQGQNVESSPDFKFDKKSESIWDNCTQIGYFQSWGHKNKGGPDDHNGFLFPKKELAAQNPGWNWQVQVWSIFRNYMIHQGSLKQVLSNEMMKENLQFKKADIAFWNHGLHDWASWNSPPYGEKHYQTVVKEWLDLRNQVPTPTIWVAMNNNCIDLMENAMINTKKITQTTMVEEANFYVHKRLREEKLPYWDAASVLRSPQRCNVSGDGVHVKMFVDIVRANILFNKLCDENFNWIGGIDKFIEPYNSL